MKNMIILAGKSASGKDTVKKEMLRLYPDLHNIITSTTRPMRDYEVDGKDYFFYTDQVMAQKIYDMEMAEAVSFNGWVYATEYDQIIDNKINLGIYNLEGAEILQGDKQINAFVVYLDCPNKVRLIRSLNREAKPDIDEIWRRYYTDEKDFADAYEVADLVVDSDNEDSIISIATKIYKYAMKHFENQKIDKM